MPGGGASTVLRFVLVDVVPVDVVPVVVPVVDVRPPLLGVVTAWCRGPTSSDGGAESCP